MRKVVSSLLFSLLALVLFSSTVFAAGFELVSIGTVNTEGNRYSQWWFETANPTFAGTADPNALVSVTVGTESLSTTASAAGAWTVTPTTAVAGEHNVTIVSTGDTYSFTLTIGSGTGASPLPTTISSVPSDVPATGTREVTLALIAGAGVLFAAGFGFYKFAN